MSAWLRTHIPYLNSEHPSPNPELITPQQAEDTLSRERVLKLIVKIDALLEGGDLRLQEAYEKLDEDIGPAGYECYPVFMGGHIGGRVPEDIRELFAEHHPEIDQKLDTYSKLNEKYLMHHREAEELLWAHIIGNFPELRESLPDTIAEFLPSDLANLPVGETWNEAEMDTVPSLKPTDDPVEIFASVGGKDLAKYTLVNEPHPRYVQDEWIEECDELTNDVYVDNLFDSYREQFLDIREDMEPDENLEEMSKLRESMKTIVEDLIDSLNKIRGDYIDEYDVSEPEIEELAEELGTELR